MKNIAKIATLILVINTAVFALPMGDPRTPDEETLSKIEVPIEQGKHEISLHTFMGASKINYPDVGGTKFSPGFGAGFSYSYFFLPKWSFLLGGGIQLFNNRGTNVDKDFSSDKFGPLETNDTPVDGHDKVLLYYDFLGYSETQWSLMFTIPLMFQYQSNESRNKALYYALGVKLGMPFAGSYEGKVESAKVCGYYPTLWGDPTPGYNFNNCITPGDGYYDEYQNSGFGDFGKVSARQKMKLGTAFFASGEAGVKWRIYNKLAVYTGFWLDYALNDVAMEAINAPFTWTPTQGNSEDKVTPKADIAFGSRANGAAFPLALGFTVRFAFGAGRHQLEPDSLKWLREISYRDSLLAYYMGENALLLDSLRKCQGVCAAADIDSTEFNKRLEELERARLAMLEAARQDSIARAEELARQRAGRLEEFRRKLAMIANGLDNYKVTQTVPSDNAKEKLDIAAELMVDYPDLKLRLVGHTCDKGTHEANVRYGIQRAESAKNYMIGIKNIDPSRVEFDTKAELEPIVPNISEDNRRKNRRVQIIIIEGAEHIEQETKK
jgi:outer membrane protein OmpA-like peptidoglycan-associated protein